MPPSASTRQTSPFPSSK